MASLGTVTCTRIPSVEWAEGTAGNLWAPHPSFVTTTKTSMELGNGAPMKGDCFLCLAMPWSPRVEVFGIFTHD